MLPDQRRGRYHASMRALALSVHVLTACGAALALLALLAATRGDWPLMFLWLGVALVVDAIDGPLARAFNVKEAQPRWSGDTLDLVVDFTTYVFVPAFAVVAGALMPQAWAMAAAAAIAITGALYFADHGMKTSDNFFLGFPAVWNLIVFYLLLLRPPPAISAAVVVLFAVLTFVPIRFVHPFRVRRLRAVTVAMLTLWAALALAALKQGLTPELWVTAALCLIAVYFAGIGLLPARGDPT
jgi:phosphatidylcholine synthase